MSPLLKKCIWLIFLSIFGTNSCTYARISHPVTANQIKPSASSSWRDWGPDKVLDDDITIGWCADVRHDKAIGEWIQFNLSKKSKIHRIGLRIGNQYTLKHFSYDAKPQDMVLEIANGQQIKVHLENTPEWQYIDLNGKVSDFIKLTIESRYPGTRDPHTCIAQLKIFIY